MSDDRKITFGGPGNFFKGIADHFKLVWWLIQDARVPTWLKLLPFGSLLYLVSPFDIPTPIDDAGVIWGFTYLFVELSPPDVVEEHRAKIQNVVITQMKTESDEIKINEEDIIDAEYTDKESS